MWGTEYGRAASEVREELRRARGLGAGAVGIRARERATERIAFSLLLLQETERIKERGVSAYG